MPLERNLAVMQRSRVLLILFCVAITVSITHLLTNRPAPSTKYESYMRSAEELIHSTRLSNEHKGGSVQSLATQYANGTTLTNDVHFLATWYKGGTVNGVESIDLLKKPCSFRGKGISCHMEFAEHEVPS